MCGLAEKLHHHVEAFERVVHNHILRTDRCEAVAMVFADTFRKARCVGREQQVGPVVNNKLLEINDPLQPLLQVDLLGVRIDLLSDQRLKVGGHGASMLR